MDWLSIGSAALGAFGTGYNIYTNKRDFDYQKALQQQIFQREDTAVQRRVADLKAAGMNPALAMGSQAGAGSVVARSNTNDINPGASLDYLNAAQQIKAQRINNQTLQYERDRIKAESDAAQYTAALTKHRALAEMGIFSMPYYNGKGVDLESIVNPGEVNWNADYGSPVIHEFNAKVKEWDWTDTKHSNETQKIINDGYRVITDQQKLYLESLKSQFSMSQESLNSLVANICKMRGMENETTRVQNELDKLDWQKDKWTYEQICSLIVGLTNSITF